MCTYSSMAELAENSLRIYNGMIVINPFRGTETPVTVTDIVLKFPTCKSYARNNSTVCFIWKSDLYAIPYTKRVIETLYENRYYQEEFYVFFSNGDFPKDEQQRWFSLIAQSREENTRDFQNETKVWCMNHGLKELPIEIMNRCMKIPDTGIEFKNTNFEGKFVPVINLDDPRERDIKKLGIYNWNNGAMCFVYIDGQTYIAHRKKTIREALENAGFTQGNIFVPMSNGERLKDLNLQREWETLDEN